MRADVNMPCVHYVTMPCAIVEKMGLNQGLNVQSISTTLASALLPLLQPTQQATQHPFTAPATGQLSQTPSGSSASRSGRFAI